MITFIIIGSLVLVGLFCFLFYTLFKEFLNTVTVTKASMDYKTQIMTVTYSNGKVEQFQRRLYWENYPMMSFAGRSKSNELDNIDSYISKWGNDYPTAHLKKLNV